MAETGADKVPETGVPRPAENGGETVIETGIHEIGEILTHIVADLQADTFTRQGILFGRIPPERTTEVCEFLGRNFYPDEPICRSLGIVRDELWDAAFAEVINEGVCVMATDSRDKIIGVRCAITYDADDTSKWLQEKVLAPIIIRIVWIFSEKLHRMLDVSVKLAAELEYDPFTLLEVLECDKIMCGFCVCTEKGSRNRGLGRELVRQSEAAAVEEGCGATAVMASGIYSAKIFQRLGYVVVKEVVYADFKDEDGEMYLQDTREHTSCLMVTKILKEKCDTGLGEASS